MEPTRYVIRGYRALINPKWFSIIPRGSRIYYIWNSVVFPFNRLVRPREVERARGYIPAGDYSH